jgi:hypothetical protein
MTIGIQAYLQFYNSLQSVNLAHNGFHGVFALAIGTNWDVSHNFVEGMTPLEWGVIENADQSRQVLLAFANTNHQKLPFRGWVTTTEDYLTSQALTESFDSTLDLVDFTGSPFVPDIDSTAVKIEFPAGSGSYPFSCPVFKGRGIAASMVFDFPPAVYGYSGGSTSAKRQKWIGTGDTEKYSDGFKHRWCKNTTDDDHIGFCTCNSPYTGTPPNCTYACGKERISVAEISDERGESQCRACLPGTTCNNLINSMSTLHLKPGFWRLAWESHDVKKCPRSELCLGGGNADDYCAENHRGPYCMGCDPEFFMQGGKCIACSEASAQSPASIALMVAAVLFVVVLVLFRLSAVFRKAIGRIPWRSVVVKSKIIVIFFQIALMIPQAFAIPFPSVYLGLLDVFQFMNINVIEGNSIFSVARI